MKPIRTTASTNAGVYRPAVATLRGRYLLATKKLQPSYYNLDATISGVPANISLARPISPELHSRQVDVLYIAVLAVVALALSLGNWRVFGDTLPLPFVDSTWFEADSPGYYQMMTDRHSDHDDTRTHPLFSLVTWPFVVGLEKVTGVGSNTAVGIYLGGVGVLWIGLLYAVLRRLGCRPLEALLFGLVALSSATARCWLAVPETYLLGGATILAALFLALGENPGELALTLGSAASLAVAVPNWMAGLAGSVLRLDWRRALRSSVDALALVVALWALQRAIFPSSVFFFGHWGEAAWILNPRALGPFEVVRAFTLHSMVLPEFLREDRYIWSNLVMTVQGSPAGSGSAWGIAAVGLWIALLVIGVLGLVTTAKARRTSLLLGGLLAGQLTLHLLFGDETFLYAPQYFALLIVLAAMGLRTRLRPAVWVLAGGLVLCAGVHNQSARASAVTALREYVARPGRVHPYGIRPPWARPRAHRTSPRTGVPRTGAPSGVAIDPHT